MHVLDVDVVYAIMKRSDWGLAAWCLGRWWCVLWIRNKLPRSNITPSPQKGPKKTYENFLIAFELSIVFCSPCFS
jgi:hypothetical protein